MKPTFFRRCTRIMISLLGLSILSLFHCYLDPAMLDRKLDETKYITIQNKLPCNTLQELQTKEGYKEYFSHIFKTKNKMRQGCLWIMDTESYTWSTKERNRLIQPVLIDDKGTLYPVGAKSSSSLSIPMPLDYKKERTFVRLFFNLVSVDPSQLANVCIQESLKTLNCLKRQKDEKCLMFVDFQPTEKGEKTRFGMPKNGQKCQFCFQEVCDGKDNNCDGKVDNIQDATYQCKRGHICSEGKCQCSEGKNVCGKHCVDLKKDKYHCGKCGNLCYSGQICDNGTCRSPHPNYKTACFGGKLFVNTSINNRHCGKCENACKTNETCQNGVCVCNKTNHRYCDTPEGKVCANTAKASHCGKCGNVCTKGSCFKPKKSPGVCCEVINGKCSCGGKTPPSYYRVVGDKCINPLVESTYCGTAVTKYIQCKVGQFCSTGKCTTSVGKLCSGKLRNITNDPNHCGTCGNKCGPGQECKAGKCQCPQHPAPSNQTKLILCGKYCKTYCAGNWTCDEKTGTCKAPSKQ